MPPEAGPAWAFGRVLPCSWNRDGSASRASRAAPVAIGVALLVLCCACAVPMRVPARTKVPTGEIAEPDPAGVQVGVSRREDVLLQLGEAADTKLGLLRADLFRWVSSSWGVGWMIAGGAPGAPPMAEGGFERIWKEKNLLVEYDENGVVKTYKVFPDSQLVTELRALAARTPPPAPDVSIRVELWVLHGHPADAPAVLILDEKELQYDETEDDRHDFRIPREDLLSIRFAGYFHRKRTPDANYIYHTLHFRRKTKVGQKLTLRITPAALMTLIRYLPPHSPAKARS